MKKRVFFIATMMILMVISAIGQSARKSYKAGMEFVDNLKYNDAVVQFTSAINLEPSNPDYYYARGQVYEKLLKYAEAKADYEKTLVFSPKNVNAMICIGAVCNKLGNYEESLKILNHATALDKRNQKVYPEKVITLYNLKRYDQALQASDTAIIIKDTPMDYYWRGKFTVALTILPRGKRNYENPYRKTKNWLNPESRLLNCLFPLIQKRPWISATK